MMNRYAIYTVLLGTILLAAIMVDPGARVAATHTQKCQALLETSEGQLAQQQCEAEQQVTWSTWFTGQSRSTQFHFLDLVELVFGEPSQQRDFKPSPTPRG
ncbi:hypothetical protein [Pseudidiomarina taiwanensis]|nr:hypothetical protein [Pseudidiomarina taiwanensis]